jgi:hypothetical protein
MRRFLKGRVSYDVLPLSFRLIMMDTSLTVKNSLAILMQNGTSRVWSEGGANGTRHCLGTSMGLQVVDLCRIDNRTRLHQRHSILLAKPGQAGRD